MIDTTAWAIGYAVMLAAGLVAFARLAEFALERALRAARCYAAFVDYLFNRRAYKAWLREKGGAT